MEFGTVTRMRSRKLNETIVVFQSVRKPGFVYKFFQKKDTEYCCCRCKELGKFRSIKVVNEIVTGRKHPEDDHHPDCEPIPEHEVQALEMDREMRQNVRANGKRPREAYNEMMTNVTKRFKSSDEQV
jgi:hypothetical protein